MDRNLRPMAAHAVQLPDDVEVTIGALTHMLQGMNQHDLVNGIVSPRPRRCLQIKHEISCGRWEFVYADKAIHLFIPGTKIELQGVVLIGISIRF
jgi:hypothetical protein